MEGVTKRLYGLGGFNIIENFATISEVESMAIIPHGFIANFPNVVRVMEILTKRSHVYENFSKDSFAKIKNNSYLDGGWCSEKYFMHISRVIRADFSFKKKPDPKNEKILSRINKCNSVSIHIRRGDYVKNAKVAKIFNVCDYNYYRTALNLLRKKHGSFSTYVFTDDPLWVKKNFEVFSNCTLVDHNVGLNDLEDLRLMSACKHNIIANSTFSWWAAWLNSYEDKIVIAPQKWYRDDTIGTTIDLIPDKWIRI
jgi:hypothetical protein